MSDPRRGSRSRIVVETSSRPHARAPKRRAQRSPEIWVAISVIIAAALATFVALYLTSSPFDPMNASIGPEQVVPAGPSFTPSPRPSVSMTPPPVILNGTSSPSLGGGEASPITLDDATIQSNIEKALAADSTLSGLDVSTLVENGRITVVGSVKSADLKQRVERTVRSLKGVSSVDNQLVVTEATP